MSEMWEEAEGESATKAEAKQHDALFSELMQECKHSAPGARLSARLRTALERLRPEERREVVSRTRDGCAPLFVACKRGNVEIVEYLVHVCDADLEQRGVYEVPDERSVHTVTPLWCAAVAGRLEVLHVLADAGADLDAGSDSGSTPVRSACFMTHVEVVRFLVSRGATIHRPNHNGGTCLINSVQSARLCALLLAHGAAVDARDIQLKTALHYAIQEHRVETARLLLEHGADPALRSRGGDDALRTACLKGASQIVQLLMSTVRYTPQQAANAFELLGATMLDEFNDTSAALAAWRRATSIRYACGSYLQKLPIRPLHAALLHAREWTTRAELEAASTDMDALRVQALLVADRVLGPSHKDTVFRLMYRSVASIELEAASTDMDALRVQALLVADRVLGPSHKDTVFRLMYRGASYADAFRYQRCIDLWSWALQIRIEKDTLLFTDTCHTACALTRLMLDACGGRLERGRGLPRHEDVLRVFRLVAADLPASRRALTHTPQHRKQAETFDRALRCVTHLIYLLLETADGDGDGEQMVAVRGAVRALLASDVRSAHTGDTILHLCVSRLNVIRSTYFSDDVAVPQPQPVFPHVGVVRLLVACGAGVHTRNEARSTALHVAAIPYNFSTELVEALLAGGAHLDTPNKFGDSAAELVALNRASLVRPLQHTTLACLAARALMRAPAPPNKEELPVCLHEFLDLHRA